MKKIFFIAIALCVFSYCDFPKKEYRFSVEYFNGQKDTINYIGIGENRFILTGGDLTLVKGDYHKAIACGIRTFHVLSMAEISEPYIEKK